MGKIIIVSNRLPITVKHDKGNTEYIPSIGGLATGLGSIHKNEDSVWIGWDGLDSGSTTAKEKQKIEKELKEQYKSVPVFISHEDLEHYYYGFCNRTVWPLFHYFPNKTVYNDVLWQTYKKVNKIFYERMLDIVEPGDRIWVQDYQLMFLPQMLKEKFPDTQIGFFLHIPFPSYEIFRLLPWREEILHGLLGADLLGFHTYDYVRHFISSARRILRLEHNLGVMSYRGRQVKAEVFPMGIDYKRYGSALAKKNIKNEMKEILERVPKTKIILSVDRLDYTKGIPERLKAFNLFLQERPEYKEKVTLILIVAPSRTGVETYLDLRREINELVSTINGDHGSLGWVPILFFYRAFPFDKLTAVYGMADMMLVTPLRDGMNLIAKEYLATRQDKKGTLILSETAGAASELGEAFIVNSNNIHEIAAAIPKALDMSEEEQIERNTIMHKRLKTYDVEYWAKDFLEKLSDTKGNEKDSFAKRMTEKDEQAMIQRYQKSAKRLLLLNYDGTLVSYNKKGKEARPDEDLLRSLRVIAGDTRNEVVVVSGRDKDTLDGWLGTLNVNIVAGHGVWTKEKGGMWEKSEVLSENWKEVIRPVFEIHHARTPGSRVEERDHSLVWHYRRCEPDLASVRVSELKEALLDLTHNLNINVVEGNKAVEIKDMSANKGRSVSAWLNREEWDFILAMGDNDSDEDMFSALPQSAYSIRVGVTMTHARYVIETPDESRKILFNIKEL